MSVAGDSQIVYWALRTLNEESAEAPDMRQIIRRILEIQIGAYNI
jgi:hypothetical protein